MKLSRRIWTPVFSGPGSSPTSADRLERPSRTSSRAALTEHAGQNPEAVDSLAGKVTNRGSGRTALTKLANREVHDHGS